MNVSTSSAVPRWFWVVAIIAIVWNVVGVASYLMEVTTRETSLAALPAAERALYAMQPEWVTGAYAIAVFAGLAGCVLLAMRRALAAPLLALSLAAVLVQMFYVFALSDALTVQGASSAVLPAAIVVIGAVLLWLAMHARRRGWLR